MEEFKEETNMEDFQLPEKLTITATEEELNPVEEDGQLNYVDIKSRAIGLLFEYEENLYLYKYPHNFEGDEGDELILLEKRSIVNQIDNELVHLHYNEFRVVEIIEVDDGYILCTLTQVCCEDTYFWILNNLQEVAIRLYNMVVYDIRYQHGVSNPVFDKKRLSIRFKTVK